jgi:hypothetical protein
LIEQFKRFIFEHSSLFITISYLLMIVIGVFHAHGFYGYFGIQILQYAELSDYLIFPFQHPVTIAWYLGLMLITISASLFDDWTHKKFPRLGRFYPKFIDRTKLNWIITLLLLFIYIPIVAHDYASDFAGQLEKEQKSLANVIISGVEKKNILVIGSTTRLLIFRDEDKSLIAPWESVELLKLNSNATKVLDNQSKGLELTPLIAPEPTN